jgi:diaminohydroxyphosphoribosylaminopyrimidine deaminase/5-amino-6-(5-phosphoribosylamino)uracil reductase
MKRCIELAIKGLGHVSPNPMVGCVIVCDDKIIGEGYHKEYGQAHAEVNAINSVQDQALLKKATLYVSLEPCSHVGKTPACSDLVIQKNIPYVVIGSIDPNPLVKGKGIDKLKNAGIKIETGILEKECKELNKRFFTFHEKKRPYIILKWAQTKDGFIDKQRTASDAGKQLKISNETTDIMVHQWRSQEQAVMAGTNTALLDNPQLTVRLIKGKNPVRIVIDNELKIPQHYRLLDGTIPTLVFTDRKKGNITNVEYIVLEGPRDEGQGTREILNELYKRNIQSVLVEGGAQLINSFIENGLWDEARIITDEMKIGNGVKAPEIKEFLATNEITIERNTIQYILNKNT